MERSGDGQGYNFSLREPMFFAMAMNRRLLIAWAVAAVLTGVRWLPFGRWALPPLQAGRVHDKSKPEIEGVWAVPAWREIAPGRFVALPDAFDVFVHGRNLDPADPIRIEGQAVTLAVDRFLPTANAFLFRVSAEENAFILGKEAVSVTVPGLRGPPQAWSVVTLQQNSKLDLYGPRIADVAYDRRDSEGFRFFAWVPGAERLVPETEDVYTFDPPAMETGADGITLELGPHPNLGSGVFPATRSGRLPVTFRAGDRTSRPFQLDSMRVWTWSRDPGLAPARASAKALPPGLFFMLYWDPVLVPFSFLAFRVWRARGPGRWILAYTTPALIAVAAAPACLLYFADSGPFGFLPTVILLIVAVPALVSGFVAGLIVGLVFRWARGADPSPAV